MTDQQLAPLATGGLATVQKGFDFVPTTFAEAQEFAKFLSTSNLIPKDYQDKPANVLIAMQMGIDVGLRPMQAIQNIAVINGRPSMWGDAVIAVVRGSGLLVSIDEYWRDTKEGEEAGIEGWTAFCTVVRKGEEDKPKTASFSVKEARQAGLWEEDGPWKKYPRRMLQMRARGFALRDAFADVLKGIITREEAQDTPEAAALEGDFRRVDRADPGSEIVNRINATVAKRSAAPVDNSAPVDATASKEEFLDHAAADNANREAKPAAASTYAGPPSDKLIAWSKVCVDIAELDGYEAHAGNMPAGKDRDASLSAIYDARDRIAAKAEEAAAAAA